MKEKFHYGHQGINPYMRRARSLILLPIILQYIIYYIEKCDVCSSFSRKQSAQPHIEIIKQKELWTRIRMVFLSIFNHETVSPGNYKANGIAEAVVKIAMKC